MAAVKRHPEIGYRILSGIKHLREAALLILHQQERYDGSGYPAGLRGDQITPGARIFAIAYTLDSLTSDRPYRPAGSFEEARVEICNSAGSQLDPSAVEAFLEIPIEDWKEIRRSVERTIRSGTAARRSALAGPDAEHNRRCPASAPAGGTGGPQALSESPLPSSWRNISLGGFI
jgi:HD-GYP domain-containing protein (c-di-GMP phosphodiesterase class II)